MEIPTLEPVIGNSYHVSYNESPEAARIIAQYRNGGKSADENIAALETLVEKEPYNFEAAYLLSLLYTDNLEIDKACNLRYQTFQRAFSIIPEEEEIRLPYDEEENRPLLTIIYSTAIDHFMTGDFEMAAALFEMLLDLDEDDNFQSSTQLSYCYTAMEDYEAFDDVSFDLSYKEPADVVSMAWESFRRNKADKEQFKATLKRDFIDTYNELISGDHDITAEYIADIESERPSKKALARKLWLQTAVIWEIFPEFLEYLKK